MRRLRSWLAGRSFDFGRALGIALIEAAALGALIFTVLAFTEKALEAELTRDAEINTQFAAAMLAESMGRGDIAATRRLTREFVETADLASMEVRGPDARLLAHAELPGEAEHVVPLRTIPIRRDGRDIGSLSARAQTDPLNQGFGELRFRLLLIALLLLAGSGAASWAFGRYLSRHLRAVRGAAERIRDGDFGATIPVRGAADLRAVAETMNAMSAETGRLHAQLNHTLDSTFAHMTEGVAIFDSDGELKASNPNFAALAGLPPELAGTRVTLGGLVDMHAAAGAYANPEAAPFEQLCRATEWDGPSFVFEMPMGGRIVAIRRTRLPDGGFIAIHEDVTSQHADQRRLLHSAKLATLGELATVTAHELNQPLNVIRLTADNARARVSEGRADADYLDAKLARISEQTSRAAAIIDHMRVFGRKPAERPQPFDLGEAVRSAVGFFTETARLEGCQLELEITPGAMVIGHPQLIEQVVANLVSNALSAFRTRTIQEPRLDVTVEVLGKQASVTVSDNGGGIPADVLPHVFEPFFTTKQAADGTGLGLSISYGIVSDMGGSLVAANAGKGAVFNFTLPIEQCRWHSPNVDHMFA